MVNIANVAENSCKSCGGYGAWIGNSLGSPAPGPALWPGFQLSGGGGSSRRVCNRRKFHKSHKSHKSRKPNRRRKLKTRRH